MLLRRFKSGLFAVTKLPRERERERLARRRRKIFRVFPSNGTGKPSRLCTAGWERDGKAGRQKVDGMGWELIISRWDGNGREKVGEKSGKRRETSWETSRETRLHVGRHINRFVAFITTAAFMYLVCVTQESKAPPTAVHVREHPARAI